MKILFIDQYNKLGGGQTILIQLINIALENNFAVTVLIPSGGQMESLIDKRAVVIPLNNLNLHQKKGVGDYFKVLVASLTFSRYSKLLKEQDLVYVNGARFFIPASINSCFLKTKIIYHLHLNHSPIEKRIIRYLSKLKNTCKVIANSEFIYESYKNKIKKKKLHLLTNALSEKFNNLPFINRFQSIQKLNFAVIGRISKDKGQHLILKIAKEHPKHNFHIIGDTDFADQKYLKELQQNAPSNILFHKKSSDIISTIDSFNIQISIVPSIAIESFGLVAIESMACSCIAVIAGKGGLKEIGEKTSAITFTSESELSDKINELVKLNEKQLEKLAQIQYNSTKKYYNFIDYKNNFIKLLNAELTNN